MRPLPSFTASASSSAAAALLAASLLVGSGCAVDVPPLGGDDRDALLLSETPASYLASALDGGDRTLQALYELGDGVAFTEKPDPSPLLTATAALDDERPRGGKVPVSVLSYNVGLLDAKLLGVIDYKATPNLDERRFVLPELIFQEDAADVVCLQEVWLEEDVDTFTAEGERLGYHAFAQERRDYNDGVMIFVKAGAIAGGTTPALVDASPYGSQDGLEFFPGPSIKRGYLEVELTHAQAGPTRVFCTHMQAFPENWGGRMRQARELGIAARTRSSEVLEDELVIVAGDLNSGPYYASTTWTLPDGSELDGWFENAMAYPLLLAYGNLVDAAMMGRSGDDVLADITQGDAVVNDPDALGERPAWCADTPHVTLTGTDCNELYRVQYEGTEAPARLDHVHVRERDDLVVTGSRIVFTEKRDFAGLSLEPSDHYGVRVDLLVDP